MSSIKLSSTVLALLLVLIGAPYGCSCIKLLDVNIPQHVVQGQDTKLVCNYDLEGDNLHSLKWYRNGHEFYRYMPTDEPSTKIFRQLGIDVDDLRSTETTIHLRNVNLDTTGQYRCEVSGDAPLFQTDASDAILTVVEYRTEEGVVTDQCCSQVFLSSTQSIDNILGIYTKTNTTIANNSHPVYVKYEEMDYMMEELIMEYGWLEDYQYYLYFRNKDGGPQGWVVTMGLLGDRFEMTTNNDSLDCPNGILGGFEHYDRKYDYSFSIVCHTDQENRGAALGDDADAEDFNGNPPYKAFEIPGGFSDIEVNDEEVSKAAADAVAVLGGVTGASNPVSTCGKKIELVGVETVELDQSLILLPQKDERMFKLTLRLATYSADNCTNKVEKVCDGITVFKSRCFKIFPQIQCHQLVNQEKIKCKDATPATPTLDPQPFSNSPFSACIDDGDCVSLGNDFACFQYICYPWKNDTRIPEIHRKQTCKRNEDCLDSGLVCYLHHNRRNVRWGICVEDWYTCEDGGHEDCTIGPEHWCCGGQYCCEEEYFTQLKMLPCTSHYSCSDVQLGNFCCPRNGTFPVCCDTDPNLPPHLPTTQRPPFRTTQLHPLRTTRLPPPLQDKKEERNECQEKRPNSMTHYAPVGSIIAWVSKPTANGEAVQIPEGWQRCDGSEIHPPSIWAGEYTPDLNHGKRFLRGGPDVDMLTMEEDQMEDHEHTFNDPGHAHGYTDKYSGCPKEYGKSGPGHIDKMLWSFDCAHERTSTSSSSGITVGAVTSSYRRGAETRPKNMNVIYIMRVW